MTEKRRRLPGSRLLTAWALAVCTFAVLSQDARSQSTRWWDRNGTTAGSGGSLDGTWDMTAASWNTITGGTNATVVWTNNNNARFSAGTDAADAFTITVDGTINVNQIGIEEGDVTFTGGTLNFTINATTGSTSLLTGITGGEVDTTTTIDSVMAGTTGFRIARSLVNGNQVVVISNPSNTLTGGIFINGGQTMRLAASDVLADANPVAITTSSGVVAILDLNGFDETVNSLAQVGGSIPASVTLGSGTLTLANPSGEVFSGIISGTGDVVKNGTGTQIFSGANTYTGGTTISAGTLQIGNGGTSGTLSNTGVVTNNGVLSFNRSNSSTYAGVIDGSGSVSKAGAGFLTLTGANTYAGITTVQAGATLAVGSANALGTTSGNTQVANGGELRFEGSSVNFVGGEPIQLAGGTGVAGQGAIDIRDLSSPTISGPVTLTANSTVAVSSTSTGTFNNANAFTATNYNLTLQGGLGAGGGGTISGAIALGTGGVTKNQSGTWVLSGDNTYNGATTITSGTLIAARNNALGTATSGTTVSAGALGFQGDINYTTAESVSIAGTGMSSRGAIENISGNNTFAGSVTLTSTASIGSTAGNLTLTNGIGGAFGLTKVGSGIVTLNGTNTYSGGTTISAGKLVVNGSIGGPVSIGPAGILGGTGTVNGSISGDGRVEPGNSPGIMYVTGNYTQTAASVLEIEVEGPDPGTGYDRLVVTGLATLAGRLEVPILAGFQPHENQEVIFLTAAGGVTGSFNSIVAPNLETANQNGDLAVQVAINANDARVVFVAPTSAQLDTPETTNWSDTDAWDTGTVPTTSTITTIANQQVDTPQTLEVRPADVAQVHRLSVSGGTGESTMTVDLQAGSRLSAAIGVTIDSNAIVEIHGASLESTRVDVKGSGAIVGNGSLVGEVTLGQAVAAESARLSPGFSDGVAVGHVNIEGQYSQNARGTLQIDVQGASTGQYDTIDISGQASLGGRLEIDAAGFNLTQPGVAIGIISAGSLAEGSRFEGVSTLNNSDIFFAPIYETFVTAGSGSSEGGSGGAIVDCATRVCVAGYYKGDMNRNGSFDPGDVNAFALALTRPLSYFNSFHIFGDESGNFDGLPGLDFDDIPGFRAAMGGAGMSAAGLGAAIERYQNVPEPTSAILMFGGILFLMPGCIRRRGIIAA